MQTKNFFKCFSNISVSFLFIWNWDDKTFIRFRSSLEHHTRFYNKSVYPFSDQNGPKPHPWGWHIPIMAYIRLYPSPSPPPPAPPKTFNNYLNGSYCNRLWKHNGFLRVTRKKKQSLSETDSIHVRKARKLWLKMMSASAWKSSVSSLIMVKK